MPNLLDSASNLRAALTGGNFPRRIFLRDFGRDRSPQSGLERYRANGCRIGLACRADADARIGRARPAPSKACP